METQYIPLRLSDINVNYHKNLYKAPQPLLESAKQAIMDMQPHLRGQYLEGHSPKFRYDRQRYTLVGNHLVYSMIACAPGNEEPFWAQVYPVNGCPDEWVAQFAALDELDLISLVKANMKASRPTAIKQKRIKHNQFCFFCYSGLNKKIALVGPNNATHMVNMGKGGAINCPNCDRDFPVTAQELQAFNEYKLTGVALIPFCASP